MDGYYVRSPRVASRVVGEEAVLVRMPESMLYVLNPSASRMWVRADGRRSGVELAEGLDPDAARAFLRRIVKLGLMESTASPREEAEPFPQEVALPRSTEPPEVSEPELVETLAGGSCTLIDIVICASSPSL